jgi:iron complex outermembrane receptor protein
VWSYEAGIKSELFQRRLRLNVDIFSTKIKNFQDTVFTGGTLGFITFNGPVRSRGVEIDTSFLATPRLRVDGGLTFADSTGLIEPIDPETNAPEVDASGNPVFRRYRRSQAPKLIFNIGPSFDAPLNSRFNWHWGANVRHRSSMFNQRQEEFLAKPLTTLDLWAGIETRDKRWGVDVVGKNVTNSISEDFASPSVDPRFSAFYGSYLAGPNPLRTVMISLHVNY